MTKFLSDSYEPYLSEEGHLALDALVIAGFDKDLAFEILSSAVSEEDLYDLPPKKEKPEILWIK